ncbi:MAG: Asp-tRNA(Asn)/Glu-tRNA(Gln) amidotransferase subunit GatB [Rickettsiaceae bacterium]|nr:Asp-tRNA(Asn)/Glu-tRNA(Gln) amidotransferase subunit GatB [Rickettsiaceae bacterium]
MQKIIGSTSEWEYVIGLEIHAQVSSNTKLFSASKTIFGSEPNSQVSFFDAGMPGMLPTLNKFCVEQAVKTGLAIGAKINNISLFDRKNYFYPDLPAGYQITQFYQPIVIGGKITILDEKKNYKDIRINHIHLEQDAGKSIHDQSPDYSFIDLNRAGIGLMEIVSEPDMFSPYEAAEYIKKIRSVLRAIGTCDGNMEQGSLRVDANVSVRKPGDKLGTRCEIKNVNSIKNVVKALEYEARRQVDLIERGEKVIQETRLFDAGLGITRSMRSKENANDYRYFPDPDLLPLEISDDLIARIKTEMPELPEQKQQRYIKEFGLSEYDANLLASDIDISSYFEDVIKITSDPKLSANWILVELFAYLNKNDLEIKDNNISAQKLANLIKLIKDGIISGKIAKQVFEIMGETNQDPSDVIKERGLTQISDATQLEKIIQEVLKENQESVEKYKAGFDKLFGFFVGQIMKKTEGKANPGIVNELLKKLLDQR